MKLIRLICIILSLAFIFTLTACNTESGSNVGSVEISVDKNMVTANKSESVKVSAIVKDPSGNVLKDAKVEFYADGTLLSYPDFRTSKVGFHKLYAVCGDVKSKEIKVMATNGNIFSVDLSADKPNILNDNKDIVSLTAKALDQNGKAVSSAAISFYDGDKIFKTPNFATNKDGVHLIKAMTGSIESNVIAISANSNITSKLQLSVDKALISNDGKDTATFIINVTDTSNKKIEGADVVLYDTGKEIEGTTLKSSEEGVHYIYALYNGNVSNTVKVTIRNPNPPPYKGPESDLPIIVINTNGQAINDQEKVPATMYVYNNKLNKPGDTPELVTPIGIKYRGQSSMTFPKRQYGIETWDDQGLDKAVSLLGLPEESDWVINGSYADKSLLRNYAAFEFFRPVSKYTPRTKLCEVYINDTNNTDNPYNYLGIYTLIEKIKIDENRLDIEQLTPEDNFGDNLTGGYIVAQDKVKEGEPAIKAGNNANFTYVAPDFIKMTEEQKNYITEYVKSYGKAVFSKDFNDPTTGYAAYLDVDSYVTVLAINEFMKTTDGMDLSTYYYKPRNGKLHGGPAWDYDLSMGNTDFRTCTEPEGWYCVSLDDFPRKMMSDPAFANAFRTKWKELRKTVLSDANIDKILDSGLNQIKNSQQRSFERWPAQWNGSFVWPNLRGDDGTKSHVEEVKRLREFLHARAKWIDENIDKEINLTPVHYDWINEFTGERMNPKK